MNLYPESGLIIDQWVNNRPFPPTIEMLLDILSATDERTFLAIYEYLLFDLKGYSGLNGEFEIADKIQEIYASYGAYFLKSPKESYKIRGF